MFNLKEYLADLEKLVSIDSGKGCVEGQLEVANFLKDKFDGLGWQTQLQDIGTEVGPMLSCVNRQAEAYDLMMMGHIDTVFPKGHVEINPFKIDGDLAYGSGIADMKQGSLMAYYIIKEMPKEVLDKLNIAVVFNPDEEIGSRYSAKAYKDIAQKSEYCYIYEATPLDGKRTIERKGAFGLTVEFFGKAGHCGYMFTNGAKSAVNELAYWILEFYKLHSEQRNTTVNSVVLEGGTASNIVPGYAKLKTSIRFALKDERDNISKTLTRLQEHAKEQGISVEIQIIDEHPLIPSEKGYRYAKEVEQLVKTIAPDFSYELKGGLSDGNIIGQFGPIVIDSLGPMGNAVHTDNEHIKISKIEESFNVSTIMIKNLAERKKV
ncbi:MAG: M20/M25/M40 family metallo-hydrolase [Clostridia bacterium]|nr:M20/M25/M40 family metallo-hydrolase [Clostridia bacterium]